MGSAAGGHRCQSVLDPSPRILAEALCLDVPIVVNRGIIGGWKYVNGFTGEFFDGESDVVSAITTATGTKRTPRSWFVANHGPAHAGRRLRDVLATTDASLARFSHVLLAAETSSDWAASERR
jgi:hypothetical protein